MVHLSLKHIICMKYSRNVKNVALTLSWSYVRTTSRLQTQLAPTHKLLALPRASAVKISAIISQGIEPGGLSVRDKYILDWYQFLAG